MQEGKNTANNMRKAILESCFQSGGHISTSMSCVEILVAFTKGVRIDSTSTKFLKKTQTGMFSL